MFTSSFHLFTSWTNIGQRSVSKIGQWIALKRFFVVFYANLLLYQQCRRLRVVVTYCLHMRLLPCIAILKQRLWSEKKTTSKTQHPVANPCWNSVSQRNYFEDTRCKRMQKQRVATMSIKYDYNAMKCDGN